MEKIKHISVWVLALIITISAAIYQRKTGPTYPKTVQTSLSDLNFESKLIRSQEIGTPCYVDLNVSDTQVIGKIFYKRYNVEESWTELSMVQRDIKERAFFGEGTSKKVLSGLLPEQPEAGKLQYFMQIQKDDKIEFIAKEQPIVIRFKGAVPSWVLAPHIALMFFSMLLAGLTLIYFLLKNYDLTHRYGLITFAFLSVGGMMFGPLVQKYAFSEFWTGVPFGWDLTDNKTLIAFLAFLIAVAFNYKSRSKMYLYAIATVVLFAVFSIPHSAFGSELNYETGKVTQGFINLMAYQLF